MLQLILVLGVLFHPLRCFSKENDLESKIDATNCYFHHVKNLYLNAKNFNFFITDKIKPGHFLINDGRFAKLKLIDVEILKNSNLLEIPNSAVLLFERAATPDHSKHFFHLLEHLLGIWEFGGKDIADEVSLVLICDNHLQDDSSWMGHNQICYHLIKAMFPKAQIMPLWHLSQNENLICFKKAITSDRVLDFLKNEPYKTDRMLGGYFQSLKPESINQLAKAVYKYFDIKPIKAEKKRLTYILRTSKRWVNKSQEERLLKELSNIPQLEVQAVMLEDYSIKQQIDLIANTDILMGAHGNGFSHVLFLPEHSSVFEFFPRYCFRVEYRIFSKIRNCNYYGWSRAAGWISDQSAEKHGAFGEHNQMIVIDVDDIVHKVKQIVELNN